MIWSISNNNRLLILNECSETELEQLNLSFRKRIESWRFDPRVKKGYWDGYITEFKNNRFLPIGLWKQLVDVCKKYNFELKIHGIENYLKTDLVLDDFKMWVDELWTDSEIKPRDYQIQTAYNILKYRNCLAELATAAGKTLIIYMVISKILSQNKNSKILIIVPKVDLVIQTYENFYEYNSYVSTPTNINIQQIYSGAKIKEKSNIVIGTYQSLVKRKKEYFNNFNVVIVDETHTVTAQSVKTILNKCENTTHRIGLSGTIPEEGTLNRMTLMAQTGPIVNKVDADFLINEGFITPVKITSIIMDYAKYEVKNAFRTLFYNSSEDRKKLLNLEQNFVIQNDKRLNFITSAILKNNKNTLVLFSRLEYGRKIYDLLRKNSNRKVLYMEGSTTTDNREYIINEMEREEDDGIILVASYGVISTGTNITNIHYIYLTESYKSDIIVRQTIGRGLRLHKSKDVLEVYDFVDDFSVGKFKNYLIKHHIKRNEIYKEQGFPNKNIKVKF